MNDLRKKEKVRMKERKTYQNRAAVCWIDWSTAVFVKRSITRPKSSVGHFAVFYCDE